MLSCLQDGSTDDKGSGEEDGEKQEADAEEVDKLSDVSSSNEADEDVPNQCLSQFVKVIFGVAECLCLPSELHAVLLAHSYPCKQSVMITFKYMQASTVVDSCLTDGSA